MLIGTPPVTLAIFFSERTDRQREQLLGSCIAFIVHSFLAIFPVVRHSNWRCARSGTATTFTTFHPFHWKFPEKFEKDIKIKKTMIRVVFTSVGRFDYNRA